MGSPFHCGNDEEKDIIGVENLAPKDSISGHEE